MDDIDPYIIHSANSEAYIQLNDDPFCQIPKNPFVNDHLIKVSEDMVKLMRYASRFSELGFYARSGQMYASLLITLWMNIAKPLVGGSFCLLYAIFVVPRFLYVEMTKKPPKNLIQDFVEFRANILKFYKPNPVKTYLPELRVMDSDLAFKAHFMGAQRRIPHEMSIHETRRSITEQYINSRSGSNHFDSQSSLRTGGGRLNVDTHSINSTRRNDFPNRFQLQQPSYSSYPQTSDRIPDPKEAIDYNYNSVSKTPDPTNTDNILKIKLTPRPTIRPRMPEIWPIVEVDILYLQTFIQECSCFLPDSTLALLSSTKILKYLNSPRIPTVMENPTLFSYALLWIGREIPLHKITKARLIKSVSDIAEAALVKGVIHPDTFWNVVRRFEYSLEEAKTSMNLQNDASIDRFYMYCQDLVPVWNDSMEFDYVMQLESPNQDYTNKDYVEYLVNWGAMKQCIRSALINNLRDVGDISYGDHSTSLTAIYYNVKKAMKRYNEEFPCLTAYMINNAMCHISLMLKEKIMASEKIGIDHPEFNQSGPGLSSTFIEVAIDPKDLASELRQLIQGLFKAGSVIRTKIVSAMTDILRMVIGSKKNAKALILKSWESCDEDNLILSEVVRFLQDGHMPAENKATLAYVVELVLLSRLFEGFDFQDPINDLYISATNICGYFAAHNAEVNIIAEVILNKCIHRQAKSFDVHAWALLSLAARYSRYSIYQIPLSSSDMETTDMKMISTPLYSNESTSPMNATSTSYPSCSEESSPVVSSQRLRADSQTFIPSSATSQTTSQTTTSEAIIKTRSTSTMETRRRRRRKMVPLTVDALSLKTDVGYSEIEYHSNNLINK